jgi:hypothetical protein
LRPQAGRMATLLSTRQAASAWLIFFIIVIPLFAGRRKTGCQGVQSSRMTLADLAARQPMRLA